jgi:hypothetical protein
LVCKKIEPFPVGVKNQRNTARYLGIACVAPNGSHLSSGAATDCQITTPTAGRAACFKC